MKGSAVRSTFHDIPEGVNVNAPLGEDLRVDALRLGECRPHPNHDPRRRRRHLGLPPDLHLGRHHARPSA